MALNSRPLNLGEILDRTIQIYRRNFVLFAGISALPAAVNVLIFGALGVAFASQLMPLLKTPTPNTADPHIAIFFLEIMGAFLALLPILLAIYTLSLSSSNYAVAHAHQGQKVTIRDSYRYALKHFWRHLGILSLQATFSWVIPYFVFGFLFFILLLLIGLVSRSGGGSVIAVLLGVLLFVLIVVAIVVAILIWLRFSLAFPASVAEGSRIWPSMMRSSRLSKGSKGRIFLMFLLIFALTIVVTYALMIPVFIAIAVFGAKSAAHGAPPSGAFMVIAQVANLSISFLVRALVLPIYVIGLMLFYYDQRTRMEGYDIEQLMAQAGWSQMPPQQFPQSQFPQPQMPPPQFPPQAMAPASPISAADGFVSAEAPETALQTASEAPREAATEASPLVQDEPSPHPPAEDANE